MNGSAPWLRTGLTIITIVIGGMYALSDFKDEMRVGLARLEERLASLGAHVSALDDRQARLEQRLDSTLIRH